MKTAFWGYDDLVLFTGFVVTSVVVALAGAAALKHVPGLSKPLIALLAQLLWYLLVFAALGLLFRIKYDRPFWSSLGWRFPFPGVAACLIAGPPLALLIGLIGYVIHTPIIKLPFEQMLADRPTEALFAVFVVVLGPVSEELAFRGFLMPLLVRSFGAVVGIGATALMFGGLHAPEYDWSWRHVLLISTVGAVLGWVRYRTESTAASTFMHATYNLTQLAGFLAASK